jgi:hypothetical protein
VRAAVVWLSEAFGFVERVRIGEDHRAQMQVGVDGAVIVADMRREQQPPQPGVVAPEAWGGITVEPYLRS